MRTIGLSLQSNPTHSGMSLSKKYFKRKKIAAPLETYFDKSKMNTVPLYLTFYILIFIQILVMEVKIITKNVEKIAQQCHLTCYVHINRINVIDGFEYFVYKIL